MPVEEIVFDFIEECEIPLMKVDSEIDVEEDMPFAGPSQIIFWWNHEASAQAAVETWKTEAINVMREL